MSIGRIFDISRRSLATYQRALDVTSHNIANADNTDYSRQIVRFSTEKPDAANGKLWGFGVTLDDVQRAKNNLVENQIRSNNTYYATNDEKSQLLSQIEGLFDEPSDTGVASLTTSFLNSWSELAVTPNSMSLRYNVIRSANQLSSKVQSISQGLDTLKTDILTETKAKVELLNNSLKNIQSLNAQIFEQKNLGYVPNDLMDKRDAAINDLSKMVNITVTYDATNSANISVGGVFALDKSNVNSFSMKVIDGKMALVTGNPESKAQINGGSLSSLMDVYSNTIPGYQTKLDDYVNALVTGVNNLHTQGSTLDDPPQTGIKFFNDYQSGKLTINSQILDDPNKIAISSDGTSGNGTIAQSIADLSKATLLNGTTLSSFYSNTISQLGTERLTAQQSADAGDLILQQLEQQKAAYSGVSVDEEMTNVIKFQRSYDASAKLIKVADDMLQTLLNMV